MMNRTFSSAISEKNCFDFLRFIFAFSVFCSHFCVSTGNNLIKWPISASMGVSGFFVISGFLIMKSYYRSSGLVDYGLKRIKRIFPAYMLTVVLCAFLFSFVSSLSFSDYFSSTTFYKYLFANLSFLNFIQPTLPGVFESNHLPYVNASLWTIKVELSLYAVVPLLVLFVKKKPIKLFVSVYILSFVFSWIMTYFSNKFDNSLLLLLRRQFLGQIIYFISGVILLFYFDQIKTQTKWLVPVSILVVVLKYYFSFLLLDLFYPFCFTVLIIWFAYYFKKLSIFSKYGDCSYGFYLFHFPVIQLFIHFGWLKQNPVLLFVVCFCVILSLSYLSWHLLEKKFLKRRFSK